MKLREYLPSKDFDNIKSWIDDERTHAMWCAGRFEYPLEKENFEAVLEDMHSKWGDTPFIASLDDGNNVGFFCYSLNDETKEGMLKFIVVNSLLRGKGVAKEMLELASQYAFEETGAKALHLNVFSENIRAKKCYQKAGFTERSVTENAFSYKDESWGRCNMFKMLNGMIREVKREEISLCANIIKKSFKTVADEYGFTEENAPRFTAFATTDERLYWHMDGEHRPMYVFEVDGVLCGYYSLLLQDNNECELNNLAVLPEYRHKGIGKELLEHSFKIARSKGCSLMNIGIVEENTRLRKWYEDNGAVHVGTKKFDFFPFTCGYMKKEL
ncbi:Protein N-acetyltransferase, RimJ/RimL family [Butyrivibrio sp. ob235]|uniref:GNAT family N-acetyltransferase n=1 Tax=Butyrivibrio sp. ob235 TaxID=1761780 RepID=UPI0008D453F6|nr:GNAT family N-acetyltransferase [Butyrivibrio sp. ob235]SEM34116.1 Protein N-acetyltransferase, RimJ/RimL family [Butyrivibrio sp. ob235]